MRLGQLNYDQFVQHGVSPPVARFITSKKHPFKGVGTLVEPVEEWDYFIPSGVEEVIGLWSNNADTYCRWKRNGVVEFVTLYHDDPEYSLIAWTEQGLLANLVSQFAEFDDGIDDRVRSFAQYVGFSYADQLLDFYARKHEPSKWHDEFREAFGRLGSGVRGIKPCP